MPAPMTTLGPLTVPTYTFLVSLGILIAVAYPALRCRLRAAPLTAPGAVGAVVDVLLAGLIIGLVMARALHVLLNWAYFAGHTTEITQLSAGGLNWHGAVIGACVGMAIMARFRRQVNMPLLLDALALVLPLMAFLSWWGCGAAHCSYGAEVQRLADYPAWMVWEERDIFNMIAPRYATQPLGMAFALMLFIIMMVIAWRGWFTGRRFWVSLALLAVGMFALGFLRGDHAEVIAGLRADQWLDAVMGMVGLLGLVYGLLAKRA